MQRTATVYAETKDERLASSCTVGFIEFKALAVDSAECITITFRLTHGLNDARRGDVSEESRFAQRAMIILSSALAFLHSCTRCNSRSCTESRTLQRASLAQHRHEHTLSVSMSPFGSRPCFVVSVSASVSLCGLLFLSMFFSFFSPCLSRRACPVVPRRCPCCVVSSRVVVLSLLCCVLWCVFCVRGVPRSLCTVLLTGALCRAVLLPCSCSAEGEDRGEHIEFTASGQ